MVFFILDLNFSADTLTSTTLSLFEQSQTLEHLFLAPVMVTRVALGGTLVVVHWRDCVQYNTALQCVVLNCSSK